MAEWSEASLLHLQAVDHRHHRREDLSETGQDFYTCILVVTYLGVAKMLKFALHIPKMLKKALTNKNKSHIQ